MVVRLIIVHICYYTSFGTQSYRFVLGVPLRVGLSLLPSASLRASVLSLAHTATQAPPHAVQTSHHSSPPGLCGCFYPSIPWVSPMAIDIQALRACMWFFYPLIPRASHHPWILICTLSWLVFFKKQLLLYSQKEKIHIFVATNY